MIITRSHLKQSNPYWPIPGYTYAPPTIRGLRQSPPSERKPWHVILPFVAALGIAGLAIVWMDRPRRA